MAPDKQVLADIHKIYIDTHPVSTRGEKSLQGPSEQAAGAHGSTGDGHLDGFRVVTWLFNFSILKVLAWKNAMEPWPRSVKNAMGAMAKRPPWQKGAMENMVPMAKRQ